MWFDEIMDDCKQALVIANKHKNIFVPLFLKLALWIAIAIFVVVGMFSIIIRHEYVIQYIFEDYYALMEVLPTLLGAGLMLYLLALIGFSLLEVGSINMFKAALSDTKPKFSHFTEGIRKYLLKVMLGKFLLHLTILLISPVLIVLYLLYAVIVGTLTAGWGILFLSVFISVYLGTWIAIIVIEGYSPINAIGRSFRLGRKYFKGLFVILLASTLISSYSTVIFGILPAVVAGWFIAGVVATYFKLVVMLIYYRNKESL